MIQSTKINDEIENIIFKHTGMKIAHSRKYDRLSDFLISKQTINNIINEINNNKAFILKSPFPANIINECSCFASIFIEVYKRLDFAKTTI